MSFVATDASTGRACGGAGGVGDRSGDLPTPLSSRAEGGTENLTAGGDEGIVKKN